MSESNGCIGVHYMTLIAHTVLNVNLCIVQWGGWEGMNKPHLQLNLYPQYIAAVGMLLYLRVCVYNNIIINLLFLERVSRE